MISRYVHTTLPQFHDPRQSLIASSMIASIRLPRKYKPGTRTRHAFEEMNIAKKWPYGIILNLFMKAA